MSNEASGKHELNKKQAYRANLLSAYRQRLLPDGSYRRFDIHQLIQHIMLLASFLVLTATGVPLWFHDAPASIAIANLWGGAENMSIIHRGAAVVLIASSAYHVIYLLYRRLAGARSLAIVPRKKDFVDFIHLTKFYFGLAKEPPKYERYNFMEKFEYWAVVWGNIAMITTGLILWFPTGPAHWAPWVIEVAGVIHGYEAILAAAAILTWHMYHVHLSINSYPMSTLWITGRLSEEDFRHHHPLEWEEVVPALVEFEEEEGEE